MGIQLYQVDHRSYLLDFRNLNANTDGHHPILAAQNGLFLLLILLDFQIIFLFVYSKETFTETNEMEKL